MMATALRPSAGPRFPTSNRIAMTGRTRPDEVRAELVRGGLPKNYLTDAEGGVLPYCNDIPSQETSRE